MATYTVATICGGKEDVAADIVQTLDGELWLYKAEKDVLVEDVVLAVYAKGEWLSVKQAADAVV